MLNFLILRQRYQTILYGSQSPCSYSLPYQQKQKQLLLSLLKFLYWFCTYIFFLYCFQYNHRSKKRQQELKPFRAIPAVGRAILILKIIPKMKQRRLRAIEENKSIKQHQIISYFLCTNNISADCMLGYVNFKEMPLRKLYSIEKFQNCYLAIANSSKNLGPPLYKYIFNFKIKNNIYFNKNMQK